MDSGKSESQENSPRGGPSDTEYSNDSTFSSVPLERGEVPVMDADLRALVEENAFQALTRGPLGKRTCFPFSDESLIMEENEFFSLTFPRKLWKIVESDRFRSICWNKDGTCIVIDVEQLKKEILEKKSPIRIFETDSIKSFIRQLNLYGFSKVRQQVARSASLNDFLGEEKETFPSSKLRLYYNCNFRRGCPHLVSRLKRRVGVKNTANYLFLSRQNMSKNFFKGDQYNLEDRQFASTGKSAKKCSASAAAFSASATASTSACASDPASTSACASDPASTSACASDSASTSASSSSFLPSSSSSSSSFAPAASVSSPCSSSSTSREKGPESVDGKHFSGKKSASSSASGSGFSTPSLSVGEAGLNQFTPFHVAHLGGHPPLNMHGTDEIAATASPYHAIQDGSCSSVVCPTVYSELAAIQAHLVRLLPFCGPPCPRPMVVVTSAFPMATPPEDQPSFQGQHCPTCSCTSSNNGQSFKGDPRHN